VALSLLIIMNLSQPFSLRSERYFLPGGFLEIIIARISLIFFLNCARLHYC
jgi:hypothetical protein